MGNQALVAQCRSDEAGESRIDHRQDRQRAQPVERAAFEPALESIDNRRDLRRAGRIAGQRHRAVAEQEGREIGLAWRCGASGDAIGIVDCAVGALCQRHGSGHRRGKAGQAEIGQSCFLVRPVGIVARVHQVRGRDLAGARQPMRTCRGIERNEAFEHHHHVAAVVPRQHRIERLAHGPLVGPPTGVTDPQQRVGVAPELVVLTTNTGIDQPTLPRLGKFGQVIVRLQPLAQQHEIGAEPAPRIADRRRPGLRDRRPQRPANVEPQRRNCAIAAQPADRLGQAGRGEQPGPGDPRGELGQRRAIGQRVAPQLSLPVPPPPPDQHWPDACDQHDPSNRSKGWPAEQVLKNFGQIWVRCGAGFNRGRRDSRQNCRLNNRSWARDEPQQRDAEQDQRQYGLGNPIGQHQPAGIRHRYDNRRERLHAARHPRAVGSRQSGQCGWRAKQRSKQTFSAPIVGGDPVLDQNQD